MLWSVDFRVQIICRRLEIGLIPNILGSDGIL